MAVLSPDMLRHCTVKAKGEQDRQSTYDVTLRRFRATIFVVEKQ